MTMSDVKRGPIVTVATDTDGTPLCPQDGLRMVTDDDGASWQCPIGVAQMEYIRRGLAAAFDRLVIRDE
jgi:hypothetical protein